MSIRRGAGLAAVAIATLLVSLTIAPVALAGFKSGAYEGTTSQETEIRFTATQLTVKKFSFSVTIDCDDGTMLLFEGEGAKAPIGEKGGFKAEFVSKDGEITSVVSGKLKHRKASGAIDTEGTLAGGGECSSSVDWSARKQKPAATG
jgi:hypothetical protein